MRTSLGLGVFASVDGHTSSIDARMRHATSALPGSRFPGGQLGCEHTETPYLAVKGFLETYVLHGIVEPALRQMVWSRMKLERCSLGDDPPKVLGARWLWSPCLAHTFA